MAQNSPPSIWCFVIHGTQSWTICTQALYVFVLANPSCGCKIVCISQRELPQFPFTFLLKNNKGGGGESKKDWSTKGVGWDADKIDYEVFPSYLLGTRLSLVIKSVFCFFSPFTPQKFGWFRWSAMN